MCKMQSLFLGEPKTSTEAPNWTDNAVDSGSSKDNAFSTIGGVRSLYVLLCSIAALIGAIILLILFTVYMYSKRSLACSSSPGKK